MTWSTASCRKVSTAPVGGIPRHCRHLPLSEEVSPDPRPPLHTEILLWSMPGVGQGRGSTPLQKQRDATA